MTIDELRHHVECADYDDMYRMGDCTVVCTDDIACALRNPRRRNGREYGTNESCNDPDWNSRDHARRIAYIIRHWSEQMPIEGMPGVPLKVTTPA